MTRNSDQYFIDMAEHVSTRATCPRRAVGCVTINKHKHILSTGYNGTPRGLPHCVDRSCGGEQGTLEQCHAVHAEMNALLQCSDVMQIDTLYCTYSPCPTCAKLIANTSCKTVIYKEEYKDTTGITLLLNVGIDVKRIGDREAGL